MKSDNAIRNGTSIFVGIIVAIAAFARGALLLPLLLVACSVWGLYVLHYLRGSLPAVPKKKAKAPLHFAQQAATSHGNGLRKTRLPSSKRVGAA